MITYDIYYDMIWCNMIWSNMIWYEVTQYDMIWYHIGTNMIVTSSSITASLSSIFHAWLLCKTQLEVWIFKFLHLSLNQLLGPKSNFHGVELTKCWWHSQLLAPNYLTQSFSMIFLWEDVWICAIYYKSSTWMFRPFWVDIPSQSTTIWGDLYIA